MFQEVEWDNLIQNTYYNIKNVIKGAEPVFIGEFIANNLDFLEGLSREIEKYPHFHEAPFGESINWKRYVDGWLQGKNLDPNNSNISKPLYNLFGEDMALTDIRDKVYLVVGNNNYFPFLKEDFIVNATEIAENESYGYEMVACLFKNVENKRTGEIIDYKWFQVIRYVFATSPEKPAIERIKRLNQPLFSQLPRVDEYSETPFIPDLYKPKRSGRGGKTIRKRTKPRIMRSRITKSRIMRSRITRSRITKSRITKSRITKSTKKNKL